MSNDLTLLAVFPDLEPAAKGIDELRRLGVADDQMSVISGVPVTEAMLGRPHQWSNVKRLALGGALFGLLVGLFLAIGTPTLYGVPVGGQPNIPIPPSLIVLFEMTMLFMMIATFLGVFLDSFFPSYRPMEYVPEISDGKIAILFACPDGKREQLTKALNTSGAEKVEAAEAQPL